MEFELRLVFFMPTLHHDHEMCKFMFHPRQSQPNAHGSCDWTTVVFERRSIFSHVYASAPHHQNQSKILLIILHGTSGELPLMPTCWVCFIPTGVKGLAGTSPPPLPQREKNEVNHNDVDFHAQTGL